MLRVHKVVQSQLWFSGTRSWRVADGEVNVRVFLRFKVVCFHFITLAATDFWVLHNIVILGWSPRIFFILVQIFFYNKWMFKVEI